jgi:hypothetical protein
MSVRGIARALPAAQFLSDTFYYRRWQVKKSSLVPDFPPPRASYPKMAWQRECPAGLACTQA